MAQLYAHKTLGGWELATFTRGGYATPYALNRCTSWQHADQLNEALRGVGLEIESVPLRTWTDDQLEPERVLISDSRRNQQAEAGGMAPRPVPQAVVDTWVARPSIGDIAATARGLDVQFAGPIRARLLRLWFWLLREPIAMPRTGTRCERATDEIPM